MEKISNRICSSLLSCHREPAITKSLAKTKESSIENNTINSLDAKSQKPWSVFGDLYWL